MTPHDEIVDALLGVPGLSIEIRLIGRVNDPVVGNVGDPAAYVFVPDLHLITADRQADFGNYGFNHAGTKALARLLQQLAKLRTSWDGVRDLCTVQVGDFFDLWRQLPANGDVQTIPPDAHGDLRDVLYRGIDRGTDCLEAVVLLGNHDTKDDIALEEINFQLRAFNRAPDGRPFLFTTHGDAFDMLEILTPDWFEEFVVRFAGATTPLNDYPIGRWGRAAAKTNKSLAELRDAIVKPEHDLTTSAGAVRVQPGGPLPTMLARRIGAPQDAAHGRFEKYYESIATAAQRGLSSAAGIRVVVVGHSHEAAMILCEPPGGGRPLLMMDTGAWIERCSYPLAEGGAVNHEPSAQLGVIHGNDIRLYQIRVE